MSVVLVKSRELVVELKHPDVCAVALTNHAISTPRDRYYLVQQMRVVQTMNIKYGHSITTDMVSVRLSPQNDPEEDKNYEVDFCSFCSFFLGFNMFGYCQFVFAL